MSERQKKVTNVLFWLAFGVFLGVSIPHIAWIVRDYMPVVDWFTDKFYWLLALGYAIAIDGIMAWLTHAQSSQKASFTWQTFLTWVFIVALVGMSWYLNWLYDAIHDPSQHYKNIWDFVLVDHWWFIPQVTVAGFTPVLLGALPVFTIAYVGVLNNVNHMKTQAAKTVEQLRQEAEEIEERTKYLNRIKNAGKSDEDKAGNAVKGVFGLVKKVKNEAQDLVGEKKVKQDPQMIALGRIVDFYRQTPHLLIDEKHAASTELMIKNMLKLRKIQEAKAWRIQAAEILKLEQVKTPKEELKTEKPRQEDQPAKMENTVPSQAEKNTEPIEVSKPDPGESKTANLDGQNEAVPAPTSTSKMTDKTPAKNDQEEPEKQANPSSKNDTQGRQEEAQSNLSQKQPHVSDKNAAKPKPEAAWSSDAIEVVAHYPKVGDCWLSQGVKSVTVDEIVEVTKQSKRRVQYQVGRSLKTTPRNAERILIDSVIAWLKTAPIPEQTSGLGETSAVGKTAKLPTTGDLSKGQVNEVKKADQSDGQNGHSNGHSETQSPLDFPELTTV